MTTPSSTRASRTAPTRSLPTLTVFSHPAARLIKTVPQLQPSTRLNGRVARDTLGVGRVSSSDVVLTDVGGPLSILVVPDPFDPTIATLVLSVSFQDPLLQGAARRFVLPFRSFQRDPASGLLVSQSKIHGFDAAHRTLYPGLGAGLKGLDGGSFWFFEDVGEDGAFDRYRWEKDCVGRRAIWTVWLISTPAPVVVHVQNLLQTYPAPPPPLPRWLQGNNGFPWRDSYSVMPTPTTPSVFGQQSPLPVMIDDTGKPSITPTPPVSRRPLPTIPSPPALFDQPQGDEPNLPRRAPEPARIHVYAGKSHLAGNAPGNDTSATKAQAQRNPSNDDLEHASTRLSVPSSRYQDASYSHTSGETAGVSKRNVAHTSGRPEYRNSLVAVDNFTGQIVGVVASHVSLVGSSSDLTQIQAALASSDDDADADVEDEDEATTPLDEPGRILQTKTPEHALRTHTEPPSALEGVNLSDQDHDEEDTITPRPSIFARRAALLHRDAAFDYASSRPPSVLAADTFAPPPLPPKQAAFRNTSMARQTLPENTLSVRSSTASAAFFSTESDDGAMSSYDPDPLEVDLTAIPHDSTAPHFVSIRGRLARDIERHRPELLHEEIGANNTEDDAATDASGSTVGGPAVRLWRKARGKTKKKRGDKGGVTQTEVAQPRIKSRQASELSDRTSKAVTALEAFSDEETPSAAVAEPQIGSEAGFIAHSDTPTIGEVSCAPVRAAQRGPGHHLTRIALRTDQVRSIEDRVWREAFDDGHLPIDAPYTHLAARGESAFNSSSVWSRPGSFADGSAFELLSAEDKACKADRKKKKQQQQNQHTERMKNMQGGTVLIEFLAGSSRIGASLIRSAGLDAGSGGADVASRSSEAGMAPKSSDLPSDVYGYVPLLPQQLLAFLGLSSAAGQATSKTHAGASSMAPPATSSYSSYFPSLSLPAFLSDASDWVTNLFSFSSTTSPTTITSADMNALTISKAEAWEYAIPDFDPSSLDQTTRPVYRRRRPVPSAEHGFNVIKPRSNSNNAAKEAGSDGPELKASVAVPREKVASACGNEQRYSILHIDSLGIGRRAFLRGDRSGIDGLRP